MVGIFGGTFDPIHYGHLHIARAVAAQCALRAVRFIPAAMPPHRPPPYATPQQRLAMVRLATADEANFVVDERELQRGYPSYSIDTVQSLQADYPHQRFCFIVGLDALLRLPDWYAWRKLLACIHFIAHARPGWEVPRVRPAWWQAADSLADLAGSAGGKIFTIAGPTHPRSATAIRARIARGEAITEWVPAAVARYIDTHQLYTMMP